MNILEKQSIKINLGKICMEISSDDHTFIDKKRMEYDSFMVPYQPDFKIIFNLRDRMSATEVKELLRNSKSCLEGNRYYTKPELLECTIDWEKAIVVINTEKNLFSPETGYKFMNILMRGIYWGTYKNIWKIPADAFLIHGCGIIDLERGYLFTGPSGSGKTTVAKLMDGGRVLNDETVLLWINEDRLYMTGTPFDGDAPGRCNDRVDLSAIIFLKHDTEVSLKPLNQTEAYRRFLTQILNTSPLLQTPGLDSLSEQADLSCEVTSRVTSYELGFLMDKSFWKAIRNI